MSSQRGFNRQFYKQCGSGNLECSICSQRAIKENYSLCRFKTVQISNSPRKGCLLKIRLSAEHRNWYGLGDVVTEPVSSDTLGCLTKIKSRCPNCHWTMRAVQLGRRLFGYLACGHRVLDQFCLTGHRPVAAKRGSRSQRKVRPRTDKMKENKKVLGRENDSNISHWGRDYVAEKDDRTSPFIHGYRPAMGIPSELLPLFLISYLERKLIYIV